MVQAWYQGGVSVFDWTDIDHPKEIAFFDRGPIDADRLVDAAARWSAYWYNGVIVSSEIARGLDIYELLPSPLISKNELDAAKTVKMASWNPQDQQKIVWPPSFALARAYLDQLERSKGLAADAIAVGAHRAGQRRAPLRRPAQDRADRSRREAERRVRDRHGQSEDARVRGDRPGQRDEIANPRRRSTLRHEGHEDHKDRNFDVEISPWSVLVA